MKFIHCADAHLGVHRDEVLSAGSLNAFKKVILDAIRYNCRFLIVSGDLFNTGMPGIDNLREVVKGFMTLKENNIPVYLIQGSHDTSPTGKTMLNILEEADLCINVEKWDNDELVPFIDHRNQLIICGIGGRHSCTDTELYKNLKIQATKFDDVYNKIFLFHNAFNQIMKADVPYNTLDINLLPVGFDYYAGGHIHETNIYKDKYVYPGPLYPTSFDELEDNKGTYILGELDHKKLGTLTSVFTWDHAKKFSIMIQEDTNAKDYESIIINTIKPLIVKDMYVTLRLRGQITDDGSGYTVDFNKIRDLLLSKGATALWLNNNKLNFGESNAIDTRNESEEIVISNIIKQFLIDSPSIYKDSFDKIKSLFGAVNIKKYDGESKTDFEDRIKNNLNEALNNEN